MSNNLDVFSKSLRSVDESPTLQEYFAPEMSDKSIQEKIDKQIDETKIDTEMDSDEFNKRIAEMFGGKMDRKMMRRIKKANKSDFTSNLYKNYTNKRKIENEKSSRT